jgi:hypothetical protein
VVGGTIGSLRKELYESLLAKPAGEQEGAAKSEFPSRPWHPAPEAPPLGRRRGIYAPRRSQQQQQEAAARAIDAQKQNQAAAAAAATAGTAATDMDAAVVGAPDTAGVSDDNKGGGDVEGAPAEDDVRSTSPALDTTRPGGIATLQSPVASLLASPMTRRQQQQQQQQQAEQQQRSQLAVPSPTSEAAVPLPPPVPSPEPPMIPPVMQPPPLSHMRVNAALHALYIVLAAAASPAGLAATRAGEGGAPYAGTLDGASLLALAVHTPYAQNAPGGALDVATLEAVLRAAANRLVGNVIIRAVEDHRIEGQYRFSVHDVSVAALQGDDGGGAAPNGGAAVSGAITPPSAASPGPAARPEASVEEQREHDEAEAADALLGVAGPLSGDDLAGLLSDDAGGVHGVKRPHGALLSTWHPGDVEGPVERAPVAKAGRAGRGGRGGASGRGGRSSAPLPASEPPARRATPPQAQPVAGGGVGAWDAHALNVQLSQLRVDVWHMNRELSGQLVSLRDEMRAQTDAVLHCLERLCFQFFSTGGGHHTPRQETPVLPTTVPADEVTALRTEVLKLRALLVPADAQNSPTGVPTPPGAVPANGDLSVDWATAADRLARSVHLPLQRPSLLPGPAHAQPQMWPPQMFAMPARASPAVDAAGVSRAVAVAAGDGPMLPPRPVRGPFDAAAGPAPPET